MLQRPVHQHLLRLLGPALSHRMPFERVLVDAQVTLHGNVSHREGRGGEQTTPDGADMREIMIWEY